MSKKLSLDEQLKMKLNLSLNNAKDLYREYLKDNDIEKRNTLISSTIYAAMKAAKEYSKILGSDYELDDIIEITYEYYIREVNRGRLLEVKSFNEIFDDEYKDFLSTHLLPKSEEALTPDIVADDMIEPVIEKVDNAKAKVNSLNKKGYTSVAIIATATGIICGSMLFLGIYLSNIIN